MAQDALGIRAWRGGEKCASAKDEFLNGRFTGGVVDLLGGALLGVFYGLSGKPVAEQIPLWHALATMIRTAGLPFIVMGDWQATPAEMAASRLTDLLGADIVALNTATNVQSGRILDYYLISRNWRRHVAEIWVETATRFATHLPVTIRLQGARSLGVGRRMIQPKVHAVDKPTEPPPLTAWASTSLGTAGSRATGLPTGTWGVT